MSIGLIFTMVIGFSISVQAKTIDKSSDLCEEIIEKLDENPEANAGFYYEGDMLHIIPIKGQDIQSSSKGQDIQGLVQTLDEEKNITVDEPQLYSLQELNDAFLTLRSNRESLGITGYGVNVFENAVDICRKLDR